MHCLSVAIFDRLSSCPSVAAIVCTAMSADTHAQSLCLFMGFFLAYEHSEFDLLINVVRAVKIHYNVEAC